MGNAKKFTQQTVRTTGRRKTVAPVQHVKGIGRMGQTENLLNPTVVDPARSKSGSGLIGQLLGPQGRK